MEWAGGLPWKDPVGSYPVKGVPLGAKLLLVDNN